MDGPVSPPAWAFALPPPATRHRVPGRGSFSAGTGPASPHIGPPHGIAARTRHPHRPRRPHRAITAPDSAAPPRYPAEPQVGLRYGPRTSGLRLAGQAQTSPARPLPFLRDESSPHRVDPRHIPLRSSRSPSTAIRLRRLFRDNHSALNTPRRSSSPPRRQINVSKSPSLAMVRCANQFHSARHHHYPKAPPTPSPTISETISAAPHTHRHSPSRPSPQRSLPHPEHSIAPSPNSLPAQTPTRHHHRHRLDCHSPVSYRIGQPTQQTSHATPRTAHGQSPATPPQQP